MRTKLTTFWVQGAALASALAISACQSSGTDPNGAANGKGDQAGQDGAQGYWQWAGNARHTGASVVAGQPLTRALAAVGYEPFVAKERAERVPPPMPGAPADSGGEDDGGGLTVHYQAPLTDGDDVFMMSKTGTWVSCNPVGSGTPAPCGANAWESQIWNEKRLHWEEGKLVEKWTFESDWKPLPNGGATTFVDFDTPGLSAWEPLFHPAMTQNVIYVPAAGGTLVKLDRATGSLRARISPFGKEASPQADTFVTSPLTIDGAGNVYYTVIRLDLAAPEATASGWTTDVLGAWLVRVDPQDSARAVPFQDLVPGAPAGKDLCLGIFHDDKDVAPWPPSPTALPAAAPCGSQRPGVNAAPAIANDGTIYIASRAHRNGLYAYLVAINPDLTPKWATSLRNVYRGGCGSSELPPTGTPGGCRAGTPNGVDPQTNQPPAGFVNDTVTSSPVIAPDGAILFGTDASYNNYEGAGHLLKFAPDGHFLASFTFGFDITPSIYLHDGTYSVVIKDNHYGLGYCLDEKLCPSKPESFFITQLSADLEPEWKFRSTNTQRCMRLTDGTLDCHDDHPQGFEWCINAAIVDRNGAVYANSEDGSTYRIEQGGQNATSIFQQLAFDAAYTPVSMDQTGRVYTQNLGRVFVSGK